MEQEEGDLERLLKWAAEIGISDSNSLERESACSCLGHSLAVSYFPDAGGRGLGAVRDLRKEELVLKIPKSALLTKDNALKDERLFAAVNRHSSLPPVQVLIVCLLYEMDKGKSSWWYPYLTTLPRSYDILSTFGEFEKQALQVDDAIWDTEKARSKAELEWKEALALIKKLNLKSRFLTFRAWLWASATISSRTLHVPWDEAGCLCPVGDLFNYAVPGDEAFNFEGLECPHHLSGSTATYRLSKDTTHLSDMEPPISHSQRLTDGGFEEDVAAYCFYARKNYKIGEQVLLCYGTYTNLELLEHYGFLLNENPAEKVFIPLVNEICSFNKWPKESMYVDHTGKLSFALLAALRLWATQPNQRRYVAHVCYSGFQLSAENEKFVMRWTLNNCKTILNSLPTSFEDDTRLLNAINKVESVLNPVGLRNSLSSYPVEFMTFMEAHGLLEAKGDVKLFISKKIKQAIDRWRLAIQWRLGYKKILVNCIFHCDKVIGSVTSQGLSSETC